MDALDIIISIFIVYLFTYFFYSIIFFCDLMPRFELNGHINDLIADVKKKEGHRTCYR